MMEENEEVVEAQSVEPEKKPNNMMAIGAIVVVAIAVLGYALLNRTGSSEEQREATQENQTVQDNSMADSNTTPAVEGASSSATSVVTENGVTTVSMEAGSFYFKPNKITVKKGDKVKVVITSKDMMHNFNIDELKVKSALVKVGETSTVEFIADKVGSFEFYCSVGQHRKNGQVGTLVVTE